MIELRPSGVAGIVVEGTPSHGYTLMSSPGGDKPLTIAHSKFNQFRTVRDAMAAADRLADLLPWDDKQALGDAVRAANATDLRVAFAERMTGKTRAQLEAEHAASRGGQA